MLKHFLFKQLLENILIKIIGENYVILAKREAYKMINSVVLFGKIYKNPIIKNVKGTDKKIILFILIVDRQKSDYKDYIHCLFRCDEAERFVEVTKENKKIIVEGSLQNNYYTNRWGKNITGDEIIVKHANLIRYEEINTDGLIIPKEVIDPDEGDPANYFFDHD